MYVRWKRKARSRRKRPTGEYSLSAALVVSERINGKPRQRILSYLGTIEEGMVVHYWHQHDFWQAAQKNLERLNLSSEERERIEAALARVVPTPTAAGLHEAQAQLKAIEQR